jgi:hypothetical protein
MLEVWAITRALLLILRLVFAVAGKDCKGYATPRLEGSMCN